MTSGATLLANLLESGVITAADLELIRQGYGSAACPTHEVFLCDVEASCSPSTLATYRAGFRRLVAAFHDRPLSAVRTGDLEVVAAKAQAEVAARLGTTGSGAAANLVDAARFFYRHAVNQGHIAANPATPMRSPRRNQRARRPLESWELAAIAEVLRLRSRDPELDLLLLDFHRETAARQSGALRLRICDLNIARSSVLLREKYDKERELPVSADLLHRILRCADDRGARGRDDLAFRNGRGQPLTRRKYNSLFLPARRELPWAQRLGISVHWYRHTTLTDIARATNSRIAAAYAGHADRSVTDLYTHVDFTDLRAAHALVFAG